MGSQRLRRGATSLALALSLALAACSSPDSTAVGATPAPTGTPSPAPTPAAPASACATPDQSSPYDPVPATAGSTSGPTWVGVFQHVDASLTPDGSTKGTPKATTIVSASGTSAASVDVPVSTSDFKTDKHTPKPAIQNGVAHVELHPQGVEDQKFTSAFTKALPVTVKVAYSFNGKPVKSSDLRRSVTGKNGTVTVSYTLANTTTTSTSACFTGFDGTPQQRTLPTPQPIVAYLSLTIPNGTEAFTAPGAAPSHSDKGVDIDWTKALFEPLGSTTQTFTVTMKAKKSSVPKATLVLADLDPRSFTGKAAATSASTLGAAQDAAGQAIAAVQSSLDALQQRMADFSNSRGSSSPDRSLGAVDLPPVSRPGVSLPGVSLPSIATPGVPDTTVPGFSAPDLAGLQQKFGALVAQLDSSAVVTRLASLSAAVDSSGSDVAAASGAADAVIAIANQENTIAQQVSTGLDALVAQLPPLIQKALAVRAALDTISADVDALHHPVDAALTKLLDDIASTKTSADAVDKALADLLTAAQAADALVKTLQAQTTQLITTANTLKSSIDAGLVAKQAAVKSAVAGVAATITSQLQSAQSTVQSLASEFDAKTAATVAKAQEALNAVGAKVGATVQQAKAAISAGAATAASQASQAIADAEASAQAQANATSATVGNGVAKANDDFAQLLCLNQQALLHQLPEGSATGASDQNGRFVFIVDGT